MAMKRLLILSAVLLAIFMFTTNIFAQDVRIMKVKGAVKVREDETKPWRKAKKGEVLDTNYELMTKKRAECSFRFGEDKDTAMTIKENSQIKFADVTTGKLHLAKGRVFSLIEKVKNPEKFEIRTPTAIAGARGTGWTMEADDQTAVRCFEGEVYVKGLDEQGNVVSDTEVIEGSGKKVYKGGEVSEEFKLTAKEKKEWNSFKDVIKDLIGKPLGKAGKALGGFSDGAIEGYLGDVGENPFNR